MRTDKTRFRPIFATLMLIFFGLTVGAVYWTTTPSYALRDLKRTLKEKDLAGFYTRVDVPRVVDSLIDAAATREVTQAAGDDWVNFRERFRGELSKVLKAQTVTQIKKDVETWFNAQPLSDLPAEAIGKLAPMRAFFRRVDDWRVDGSIAQAGDKARVNLIVRIPKLEKSYPLVLLLEKKEIWQLTGIEGLSTVLDLFDKNSAAFVEAYNQRMEDELRSSIDVRRQEIRKDQNWIVNKSLYIALAVRNQAAWTMEALQGEIILKDGAGQELIRYPFQLKETDLPAGEEKIYSITADIKLFDQAANRVFAEENLDLAFAFQSAAFAGQKPFSRARNLDEVGSP